MPIGRLKEFWYKHKVYNESEFRFYDFPLVWYHPLEEPIVFHYIPDSADPPEYVYVPESILKERKPDDDWMFMYRWNHLWESAHLRFEILQELTPPAFKWLEKYEGNNIYLLLSHYKDFYAYLPFFHLLSLPLMKNHGIPPLKGGTWPSHLFDNSLELFLPDDIKNRLSLAFAKQIWPLLNNRSYIHAYSEDDPIKILAHNLDFWLPYLTEVIETRIKQSGRYIENPEKYTERMASIRENLPPGINVEFPRNDFILWEGQEEVKQVLTEMMDIADKKGKLRTIFDAIQSNRIEDDFSDIWSYEKEDFERNLYNKRSKYKVTFVELTDTIPVHGNETQVIEDLFWEDFMGVLNPKEKEIIVLIRNGTTKLTDIAETLGYSNHSPVSKALKRIQKRAKDFINNH
jgi:hypothetical protein